ncbi:hypothetical protein TNCV_2249071 [Trichonephila clavipes]|nr:hypothetical protein TNCV_2249071 [Trichonephila clavipes]
MLSNFLHPQNPPAWVEPAYLGEYKVNSMPNTLFSLLLLELHHKFECIVAYSSGVGNPTPGPKDLFAQVVRNSSLAQTSKTCRRHAGKQEEEKGWQGGTGTRRFGDLPSYSIHRISSLSINSLTSLALYGLKLTSIIRKPGLTASLKIEHIISKYHPYDSKQSQCLFQRHGGRRMVDLSGIGGQVVYVNWCSPYDSLARIPCLG